MKRLRRAACVAICGTILVAGCTSGTATVTGTLLGADGHCLYVVVPHGDGTDRYWLRHLPSGYETDERGLYRPDGTLIRMRDSLTVSGVLSWEPFDRQCAGAHTLDVTAINQGLVLTQSHRPSRSHGLTGTAACRSLPGRWSAEHTRRSAMAMG